VLNAPGGLVFILTTPTQGGDKTHTGPPKVGLIITEQICRIYQGSRPRPEELG
jgi:hypothetical protein